MVLLCQVHVHAVVLHVNQVNVALSGAYQRPAFTQAAFLRHLIDFIVADDQVC